MTSYAAPPVALWVVPVSDLGGVARHVLDVARVGLPGWRLVVLCPDGPLAEELRRLQTGVLTGRVAPADGIATGTAEVRRVVTRLRPRVVHSHLSHADLLVALATVGLGCAVVTTEHGIARDDLVYHGTVWRARLKAAAHTARLRRADALIAVSASTAEVVGEKWHPSSRLPIHVIPNGVDAVSHASPGPGLRIASLARLAPEKGLQHLVTAFALVAAAHPTAHLILAGEGPLRAELTAQVAQLGLSSRVDLPGHVDAGELLSRTDVVAQLSVWENLSYTLLDALVRDLGVVATAVGGNPEILPERCLAPADRTEEVAARIVDQGLDVTTRPTLPAGWPTVAAMAAGITEAYAEALIRAES